MTEERVQKLIAKSGVVSRRKAEELIRQGRVKINHNIAKLGDKAGIEDKIYLDGKLIEAKHSSIQIIILNKPPGYISSRSDPQKRKSVFDLLPILNSGRWISVGRLDINTTGLLLFTNDGQLANQLMHPSANLEREYKCRVFGNINDNKINKLKIGIKLENEKRPAFFTSIQAIGNTGKNHWFKVVLTQGRYREVRRLWQAVDCQVSRLTRIRYGNIVLPDDLTQGKYRQLTQEQIQTLKQKLST